MYESVPGRSAALNAAIDCTHGDLVAMIDDDEEVDRRGCAASSACSVTRRIDFIGGPVRAAVDEHAAALGSDGLRSGHWPRGLRATEIRQVRIGIRRDA